MTLIKPRAERELKNALKDFIEAAGLAEGRTPIRIQTFTVDGAHAILSVRGKDLGPLKQQISELRTQLEKAGIVMESEEHHAQSVEGMAIVFDGFGGPDMRGRYCEARTIKPSENGGNAKLLGKLRDGTAQLQIEAAKPASFRDRLTAEPRAAGQSR